MRKLYSAFWAASIGIFLAGLLSVANASLIPAYPPIGGAGTIVRSDGAQWQFTTATFPATTTVNQLLYSSATNTVAGLATTNSAFICTNGSGVPAFCTTSAGLLGVISDPTGTGSLVFATSPRITTDIAPATDGGASSGTSGLRWSTVYGQTADFTSTTAPQLTLAQPTTGNGGARLNLVAASNGGGTRRTWQMGTDLTAAGDWQLSRSTTEAGTPSTSVLNCDINGACTFAGTLSSGAIIGTTGTFNRPDLAAEVLKLTSVATNDDPNFIVYQSRVATTDATLTTLQTVALSASNTYIIEARVVTRRTGGAAGAAEDGAVYIRRGAFKVVAGVATLIGSVQDGLTSEDQAGWDVTLTASGGTADVYVNVTGAASNNIVWHTTTIVNNVGT